MFIPRFDNKCFDLMLSSIQITYYLPNKMHNKLWHLVHERVSKYSGTSLLKSLDI